METAAAAAWIGDELNELMSYMEKVTTDELYLSSVSRKELPWYSYNGSIIRKDKGGTS